MNACMNVKFNTNHEMNKHNNIQMRMDACMNVKFNTNHEMNKHNIIRKSTTNMNDSSSPTQKKTPISIMADPNLSMRLELSSQFPHLNGKGESPFKYLFHPHRSSVETMIAIRDSTNSHGEDKLDKEVNSFRRYRPLHNLRKLHQITKAMSRTKKRVVMNCHASHNNKGKETNQLSHNEGSARKTIPDPLSSLFPASVEANRDTGDVPQEEVNFANFRSKNDKPLLPSSPEMNYSLKEPPFNSLWAKTPKLVNKGALGGARVVSEAPKNDLVIINQIRDYDLLNFIKRLVS
ncbi:hypothetical protein RND71_032071 [Anisodus tanguticus]|uniref:Uncharacterized protein n=1 Tax=Anisodus tanguticus TaxID=243964 RepID=A0AAE1V3U5_9SOLA|nr:hypothetical protein RND71_032071 [Anisodus tanguticus]